MLAVSLSEVSALDNLGMVVGGNIPRPVDQCGASAHVRRRVDLKLAVVCVCIKAETGQILAPSWPMRAGVCRQANVHDFLDGA